MITKLIGASKCPVALCAVACKYFAMSIEQNSDIDNGDMVSDMERKLLTVMSQYAQCRLTDDSDLQNLSMQTSILDLVQAWASSCQFIYVGGVARSGTTYIKGVLDSHSNISCGHELKLEPLMASIRKQWWTKEMSSQLLSAGITESKLDSSFAVFAAVYVLLNRQGNKKRIASKTPHLSTEFATFHRWFPQAKFIHVLRDCRAVTASLLQQRWIDLTDAKSGLVWYCRDAAGASRYWRHILETSQREEALIPKSHYHTIRYEELVADPETTLKAMFEFLGEPWQPEILQKNPVHAESLDRWKTLLKEEQLQDIQNVSGALMASLGYH